MTRYLMLICMCCACAQPSMINLTIQEQQNCMKIFREIIKIQNERNSLIDEMSTINQFRKERQISKKKHAAFSAAWIEKENELAARVNNLYITGYAKDCFKERKKNEQMLGVDE